MENGRNPAVCAVFVVLAAWSALSGGFHVPSARAMPEFRTFDGSGNNLSNPGWGAAGAALLRLSEIPGRDPSGADPAYADGLSAPNDLGRPSARAVSNAVHAQGGPIANSFGLSDLFWQWGQFLDHDIDQTPTNPSDGYDISVPAGDPWFDPSATGSQTISFDRSASATDGAGVRQQVNAITAFIDGSGVYGSNAVDAAALRSFAGGRMKTSDGDLLPLLSGATAFSAGDSFVAGDERANEQVGLTAMHTLFVREHNRLADEIAAADPAKSDEQIYQEARRIVGAEIQAITYREFLPLLLGSDAPGAYASYDPTANPGIANAFSTAAYRFGHTMLSGTLNVYEGGAATDLALRDAFFNPDYVAANGIEGLLQGFREQLAQEIDPFVTDDVRNFLFGPLGAGGFDLASLNIQRGRDHGLPGYNDAREAMGLARIADFSDPIFRGGVGALLASVYGSVDDIDLWTGGLSEGASGGGLLGELFSEILLDQFERLRVGDRFWYENTDMFGADEIALFGSTTLADVISRNTGLDMTGNAFLAAVGMPAPATAIGFLFGVVLLQAMRRRPAAERLSFLGAK
jgi:peroxidase